MFGISKSFNLSKAVGESVPVSRPKASKKINARYKNIKSLHIYVELPMIWDFPYNLQKLSSQSQSSLLSLWWSRISGYIKIA